MAGKDLAEREITDWVAHATGHPVTAFQPVVGGYSRRTYSMSAGGRELIARVDVTDGPFAGTDISLRHEAEVYRALARTALPVPALLDVRADGHALLFERAAGVTDLLTLDEASRESVVNDYIDQLAALHELDPVSIGLQTLGREEAVRSEIDRWQSVLDARSLRPWPVIHFALRMLRRHVPTGAGQASLCHGDAGPNNFLHDGSKVTTLLDWEFWHIGDPADDLAWWVFRAHQRGHAGGDLGAQLARWQQTSGRELSAAEMDYYMCMVLTRTMVIVAAGLDQQVTGVDHTVFFGLVPMLSVQVLRGLAQLEGIEAALPSAPEAHGAAALGDEAVESYRRQYVGRSSDAEGPRLAVTSERYLGHLSAVSRYGPDVLRQEAIDAGEFWGLPGADPDDVSRHVARLIDDGAEEARMILYLLRQEYRRAWLWPATLSQSRAEPVNFTELLRGANTCTT